MIGMIEDKELAEYHSLCATMGELQKKFEAKKKELRRLLEETAVLRRDALLVLAKADRLTKHLTGGQRQITGLYSISSEIKTRINQVNMSLPALFKGGIEKEENFPELSKDYRNRGELKRMALVILGIIDSIKKKLLQLELLELRSKELIVSINKAMEAFRHELTAIRRKIYPFGIFSLICRSLRFLRGESYFSHRDLDDISALGAITGLVLKIADSPLL